MVAQNPQKLVATVSRREGVYNRTGEPSVIFAEKEEQRNECEAIKNRRKRYVACDDVVDVNGLEPLTLRTSSECSTN